MTSIAMKNCRLRETQPIAGRYARGYRSVTGWFIPSLAALTIVLLAQACATESEITRGRKVVASLAVAGVEVIEGFEAWDLAHQRAIVDRALGENKDPTQELVAYRKVRDEKVVPAIRAYTAAVRSAARALDAAEGGSLGVRAGAVIDAAFSAGAALVRVLQAVGYDVRAIEFLLPVVPGGA